MKVTDNTYPTRDFEESLEQKEIEASGETTRLGSSNSCKKKSQFRSRGSCTARGPYNQREGTRAYYQEIKDKIKKLEMPLWNATATTWVRDESPKHKIPKAERFSSLDSDYRRNGLYLKLELSGNLLNSSRGRLFAKSRRTNHFLDKRKADHPSSASYQIHRFLSNSKYKSRDLSPEIAGQSPQTAPNMLTDDESPRMQNPERLSPHYDGDAHDIAKQYRFDELRGRTFGRAENYHKMYLSHGKQFAYNQHFHKNNPGVGAYTLEGTAGKDKCAFSLRKVLYRFNQRIKASPGPADYVNSPTEKRPSTTKSTITQSIRLNLAKPLNTTPGPAFYDIRRYLEKKEP